MKVVVIGMMAFLLAQAPVFAQANGQIIVSGEGFNFSITVPAGWESTPAVAKTQGLKFVVVPEGQTWEDASTVMYSNVAQLNASEQESIYDLINFDLEMYRLSDSQLKVKDGASVTVNRGKNTAIVVNVHSPKAGTYEAIAYVSEKSNIPFLVMSATDQADFERNYPAFESLVNSFQYQETAATVRKK